MHISPFMRKGVKNAPLPGTPAWRKYLTASKISAVMRTSPWQTRFQLWHEMAGNIEVTPPHPAVLDRGHRLEEPIARWLADQHPELRIRNCGGRWWQVGTRYAATPDRLAVDRSNDHVAALVEIKTASNPAGWGTPGTDEIPPYYFDQVQWQMYCTGADRVIVAVLGARLEFAEYLVERDDTRISQMVRAADEFMDSLETGVEPDWKTEAGDFQVYETMRELHPDIEPYSVEATDDAALAISRYRKARRLAEVTEARAKAFAAAELEDDKTLTHQGGVLARRTARKSRSGESGTPFITFAKEKK